VWEIVRLPPRHHIHYGHHHMGEGGTSAAEKEKTGHHAWVSHLLDAAAARYPVAFDRHTSRQWRTFPRPGMQHLRTYQTCSNWKFCVSLIKSMKIFLLVSTVAVHQFVLSVVTSRLSDNKFSHRNFSSLMRPLLVIVAVRSKAWTDFARSNAGIVASNPTQGMDICVYSVFVLSCVGSGLATGWSPSKVSYRLCIALRNWSETKRFMDVLCSKFGGTEKNKRERERERERMRPLKI
jgi:hypothetical protein